MQNRISIKIKTVIICCLGIIISYSGYSQRRKTSAPAFKPIPEEKLGDMKWRLVGPFRGGRAGTVTGVPGDRNLYYMGTAGGGVWKTADGGQTWECISDGYFGGSIGSVAVSEKDPNVIYVGEGEQTVRGNVSSGWGMWRSTDAGKTWKHIGLKNTEHIARIQIHPENPDIVYVAAMGNLWKPNAERGIFRSKNGGETWEKVLFESADAGAVDIALDPNNPRIIYANTWQIKRNGYRMDSGGPGSKLWRSFDGGDNWENISSKKGLPSGVWGISGVTISPVNSDRIWVIIEHKKGGVYRSDDGGETWSYINSDNALRQRAWYYSRIYADTQNEDRVYVMNVSFLKSNDGGKSFIRHGTPHGDHHDLWIDPNDNMRMVVGDDGGAQVSFDGAKNWTTYHNQPTAQFYRVTTDNHFPFRILGAQQDNSTVRILHRSPGNAINESHWERSAGGESAHLAPDPDNPDIVYGGTYKGYMTRLDHSTGQTRSTNVWPYNPAGSGVEVMKYRFNWNYPVSFSPHDSDKLYAGSNFLHVTTNEGQSWEVISPDLTRNDPKTLYSSGGPITQDNTGVEYYGTIFVITESPQEKGVIYTGSDDGLVQITKDNGETWTDITPSMAPKNLMVNSIDVDPHNPAGVYIAGTAYKFGDYTPYLFKSQDYGTTWTKITKGIDPVHYTRVLRADIERKGLLYAGTEWGMYVSYDDGANWQSFQINLPITAIRDLHVREEYLIAATHGRSFWMIDDLSPIRQANSEVLAKDFHLYKPKDAYRMAQGGWGRANTVVEGQNHPNGVLFNFFVKDAKDTVTFTISEADGDIINTYSNYTTEGIRKLSVQDGGNSLTWDLRYPGFTTFPGMVLYSSPNNGPKAVPGLYRATLSVNGETIRQDFNIIKDPRLSNTAEDFQKQFDFLTKVRDKVSQAHEGMLNIDRVRGEVTFIKKGVEDGDLKNQMESFLKKLSEIENNIHQTKNKSRQDPLNHGIKVNNRLAFLLADQQRGDFPPTDQAGEVFIEMAAELDGYLDELNTLLNEEIPNINLQLQSTNKTFLTLPQ